MKEIDKLINDINDLLFILSENGSKYYPLFERIKSNLMYYQSISDNKPVMTFAYQFKKEEFNTLKELSDKYSGDSYLVEIFDHSSYVMKILNELLDKNKNQPVKKDKNKNILDQEFKTAGIRNYIFTDYNDSTYPRARRP